MLGPHMMMRTVRSGAPALAMPPGKAKARSCILHHVLHAHLSIMAGKSFARLAAFRRGKAFGKGKGKSTGTHVFI